MPGSRLGYRPALGGVPRRRFVVCLLLVAAFAFVGRAAYILMVTRDELTIDQLYFYKSAAQLADGDVFKAPFPFGRGESAEHAPLPTLALAPVALVSGDDDASMRMVVALAGVGLVVIIGLIAREIAGERAGLVAAAIAAVYPNLWINDGILMSETFATLFTAVVVLACYRLIRRPTLGRAAIVGGACALAMLSRAELALLIPLVAVPISFKIRGIDRTRRSGIVIVALGMSVLLVAPWVVFNLTRFEKPVFLTNGDGGVLAGANCDRTYWGADLGSWNGLCTLGELRDDHSPTLVANGERSIENDKTRGVGMEYMREHLGRLAVVIPARVARLWSFFGPFQMARLAQGEGKPLWASWAGLGAYWLLVGFAIAGGVLMWRRHEVMLPLIGPILVVSLVAAAFYGLVRFRAPAEVSIVVLAGIAIDATVPRRARRSISRLRSTAPFPRPFAVVGRGARTTAQ